MNTIKLSSSILSADFSQLGNQIKLAENAGVDWIHLDVMDGHFVPNITMGPFIVETCRRITNLPLDVHLMIEKPEKHIHSFINAGANTVSIHVENNPNALRTLQEIQEAGSKAGIVLNPGTPAIAISSLIEFADMVLVMTVNPGYSGQKFMPQVVKKIREVSEMTSVLKNKPEIEVDGGISVETIKPVYEAGARVFVAATAIFKHKMGIETGIKQLRQAVN